MPQYDTNHEKYKKIYIFLLKTQPYFSHALKCTLTHKTL